MIHHCSYIYAYWFFLECWVQIIATNDSMPITRWLLPQVLPQMTQTSGQCISSLCNVSGRPIICSDGSPLEKAHKTIGLIHLNTVINWQMVTTVNRMYSQLKLRRSEHENQFGQMGLKSKQSNKYMQRSSVWERHNSIKDTNVYDKKGRMEHRHRHKWSSASKILTQ